VRGGVHPILRAKQAAQQLGVLDCSTFVHDASGWTGGKLRAPGRSLPDPRGASLRGRPRAPCDCKTGRQLVEERYAT
jgi:hypothetical protein